ncbi:MAG TPA: HAD-IB family hydrolase [Alphaproteobacteria bacterium]|nr:HAD-IB family hydrolase [Alphaproteobacteria bacterium]
MSRPGIAVFDLDHTLTRQDSFPMWIAILVGWRRTLRAFAMAGFAVRPGRTDLRGRAKEVILRWSVRGATLAEAQAAGRLLGQRMRWRENVLAALNAHKAAGCAIVIATGAPTLYVGPLLRAAGIKADAVIGTELEVVDGKLTGRLAGANCIRDEKARRVAEWITGNGPFGESWGYGNRPHDLAMLDLIDNPMVIDKHGPG